MSADIVLQGERLPVCRPPACSAVVRRARQSLDDHLTLAPLIERLTSLGCRLHDVQLSLEPFNDLHAALQRAGMEVIRLADSASETVSSFRHASSCALDELDEARDLLLDGMSHVALTTLKISNERVSKIGDKACLLAGRFADCAEGIQKILDDTLEKQREQDIKRQELCDTISSYELLLARAREARLEKQDAAADAGRMYAEAVSKEEAAEIRGNCLQVAQFAAVVGSVIAKRPLRMGLMGVAGLNALSKSAEGQVLRAREEKAVHLRRKQLTNDEQLQLGNEIAELKVKLRTTHQAETIREEAIRALEKCVQDLRLLASSMLEAETFWKRVHSFCDSGEIVPMEEIVQTSSELAVDEQRALWRSRHFKERLVLLYAHWVALFGACDECMVGLQGTRITLRTRTAEDNANQQVEPNNLAE